MPASIFTLGFIMDVVILVTLAATIFYAMRLSGQLKILKDSKSQLELLVSNLAINITRAQEAIQEMHDVANEASDTLQGAIKQARGMSDELELITEAGENLADRLEAAATGKRVAQIANDDLDEKPELLRKETKPAKPVTAAVPQHQMLTEDNFDELVDDNWEDDIEADYEDDEPVPAPQKQAAPVNRLPKGPKLGNTSAGFAGGFMIRDREFEDGAEDEEPARPARARSIEAEDIEREFEALTSRAERELASALKRRRPYDA
ncbi:MAG: DUF6468 domain-containing protein [Pseudobdellovibrionaceae bacterium]